MLAGAFTAAAVTYYSGSPWVGLLAAMLAGMLVALDPCRGVHPLPGRPGGQRHGDQHPDVRRARLSERRLVSLLRLDAADAEEQLIPYTPIPQKTKKMPSES